LDLDSGAWAHGQPWAQSSHGHLSRSQDLAAFFGKEPSLARPSSFSLGDKYGIGTQAAAPAPSKARVTKPRKQGYWAVPGEKCLKHRSFWRELFGPAVGPEHYCVNEGPAQDWKNSSELQPVQKCYDNSSCSSGRTRRSHAPRPVRRPVLPNDPDYPNTVIYLTKEADDKALGLK
ncbi:unnamed protein product, partial [Symbiodinium natans]